MNTAGVLLVDAGLALVALGGLSLGWPLRFLRIRTRVRGALVAVAGVLLILAGFALPAPAIRVPGPPMRIDEVIPEYEFAEAHEIRIHAPAERVWRAIHDVTAGEIRLFRLLTWLRSPHLPGRGRDSILNVPARRPILEVALATSFVRLAEEPEREFVFGTLVCCDGARALTAEEFRAATRPGIAAAVMNFRLEDAGGGVTLLRTQTRVHGTDDSARRRFAVYWRIIYPGSAFIRRTWLAAIRRRAEAAS